MNKVIIPFEEKVPQEVVGDVPPYAEFAIRTGRLVHVLGESVLDKVRTAGDGTKFEPIPAGD